MEGLSVLDANLVVYLHPSQLKNVSHAILRHLSSFLFKYSETFDGVVLAYGANAPDKTARILSGVHPYIGHKLKANLLIFSPKPDMLLEGKVVKVAQESIHVIVLGFACATIKEEEIRNEFKYKTKHGEGVLVSRSQKKHVIKVGTVIRFVMKSLEEEVLHMSGSLIPPHTGSIRWLEKNTEVTKTESSGKKRGREEGDDFKVKKLKKQTSEDN